MSLVTNRTPAKSNGNCSARRDLPPVTPPQRKPKPEATVAATPRDLPPVIPPQRKPKPEATVVAHAPDVPPVTPPQRKPKPAGVTPEPTSKAPKTDVPKKPVESDLERAQRMSHSVVSTYLETRDAVRSSNHTELRLGAEWSEEDEEREYRQSLLDALYAKGRMSKEQADYVTKMAHRLGVLGYNVALKHVMGDACALKPMIHVYYKKFVTRAFKRRERIFQHAKMVRENYRNGAKHDCAAFYDRHIRTNNFETTNLFVRQRARDYISMDKVREHEYTTNPESKVAKEYARGVQAAQRLERQSQAKMLRDQKNSYANRMKQREEQALEHAAKYRPSVMSYMRDDGSIDTTQYLQDRQHYMYAKLHTLTRGVEVDPQVRRNIANARAVLKRKHPNLYGKKAPVTVKPTTKYQPIEVGDLYDVDRNFDPKATGLDESKFVMENVTPKNLDAVPPVMQVTQGVTLNDGVTFDYMIGNLPDENALEKSVATDIGHAMLENESMVYHVKHSQREPKYVTKLIDGELMLGMVRLPRDTFVFLCPVVCNVADLQAL